jgi:hypothetical protein
MSWSSPHRAAVIVLPFLLLASSALAQKVTVDSDKSADLSRFKRYSWAENSLMTSLHPDDKVAVETQLNDSINRQMQAKGYILDDANPDFRISYIAGGQLQSGVGIRPEVIYTGTTGPTTMVYIGSMDVWATTLAQMQISVADAASNASVWRALVSQKIGDRNKFLRELDKNVDKIVVKALQKFPRAAP